MRRFHDNVALAAGVALGIGRALACLIACGSAGGLHAQTGVMHPLGVVCETVRVPGPPKDSQPIAGPTVGTAGGGSLGHTAVGTGQGSELATAGGVVASGYPGKPVQENYQAAHPTYHYEQHCHQDQG
ncbi:hypothetical protein ACFFJT_14270 [Dyella flava]|uniref:Glycine zipper n=1 Tax=Dyella flava TaxID=1920170 RepID=A0ABS2K441_9GAMM|nr:hypothetical protein [Dyella flava]MBM7125078.1 hypothetical protein [Dyella flava]GLQ51951.1 hypothetical protein GCM10010872_34000 [Dyella flava]